MKINQIISLITLFILLAPYFSLAQGQSPGDFLKNFIIPTQVGICNQGESLTNCVIRIIEFVLRLIMIIAIGLAAIMIVWAGILYIRGGGDDKKIGEAKNRLIFAAIGLVVAILAWVIVLILSRWVTTPGQL